MSRGVRDAIRKTGQDPFGPDAPREGDEVHVLRTWHAGTGKHATRISVRRDTPDGKMTIFEHTRIEK